MCEKSLKMLDELISIACEVDQENKAKAKKEDPTKPLTGDGFWVWQLKTLKNLLKEEIK